VDELVVFFAVEVVFFVRGIDVIVVRRYEVDQWAMLRRVIAVLAVRH
jgi:hypothetical protein